MAEFDFLTILLPTLISAVIAFLILGLQRFARTSEDTTSHTVKVKDIEVRIFGFEKEFDKIDADFKDVWRAVNTIRGELNLHEYRLNQLGDKKSPI